MNEFQVPKRIWSATLLSALARQWGALCTFLSLAVLARALAPEDFGRFTFYLAVFGFLDVFVDCGTSSVAVQVGARDARAFAAALAAGRRVRFVAALAGGLALALAAGIGRERDLGWVCLAALGPLARVPEMSAVVFQRNIEWGTPLFLRALGAGTRLCALVALSRYPELGFGPFLVAHTATQALGNIALHYVARARLPAPAPPLAGLFARAWPLAALGLVQQAYFWADNGFVRALAGEAELGRYNAAVRAFQWLAFFAAFATTSALPWLARRHQEHALGEAVTRLAQPLFTAGCALSGLLLPWSGVLLACAYGPGFDEAAVSLRWLLVALALVYPGAVFLTALIAAGATRAALGVALAALVVNLAGNALSVPRCGAEGAAMMTLLTEATVTFGSLFALRALGGWPASAPLRWALGPLVFALATLLSRALFAAAFGA
ncbi:MAG: lipopolysaccharide biosynthesis protein [Planctomycetes bacterium]|nr:lipopolysaccharide biosynthesis protein [Planctomycetota bacterium]